MGDIGHLPIQLRKTASKRRVATQCLNFLLALSMELGKRFSGRREGLLAGHVLDRVTLYLDALCALLQDGEQSRVARVSPNGMNDWVGEFALGEVLAVRLGLHASDGGSPDRRESESRARAYSPKA